MHRRAYYLQVMAEQRGFVPVTLQDGVWRTPIGTEVQWFEVQSDVMPMDEIDAAIDRVMSVYGVSDVVADAVDQLRKELRAARPAADAAE